MHMNMFEIKYKFISELWNFPITILTDYHICIYEKSEIKYIEVNDNNTGYLNNVSQDYPLIFWQLHKFFLYHFYVFLKLKLPFHHYFRLHQ